jgi:hypothetical protein
MVISKKGRRDNAYREIERQRQVSQGNYAAPWIG